MDWSAISLGHKRLAISPVLATVILIAITLIAAIAIAGFVFGLFGSFTSSATVQASALRCQVGNQRCLVSLQNTGSSATQINGCTISYNGAHTGTLGAFNATSPQTLNGGATFTYQCTIVPALATAPTSGSAASGSFQLGNGGQVQFSGTWQ